MRVGGGFFVPKLVVVVLLSACNQEMSPPPNKVISYCRGQQKLDGTAAQKILDSLAVSSFDFFQFYQIEKDLRKAGGVVLFFDGRKTKLPLTPRDYRGHAIVPNVIVAAAIVDGPIREDIYIRVKYTTKHPEVWYFEDSTVNEPVCR